MIAADRKLLGTSLPSPTTATVAASATQASASASTTEADYLTLVHISRRLNVSGTILSRLHKYISVNAIYIYIYIDVRTYVRMYTCLNVYMQNVRM